MARTLRLKVKADWPSLQNPKSSPREAAWRIPAQDVILSARPRKAARASVQEHPTRNGPRRQSREVQPGGQGGGAVPQNPPRATTTDPQRATPPQGAAPRAARALPWCRARTRPWRAQRRRPPPGRRPQLAWRPPARVNRWQRAGSRGRAGQGGPRWRAGGPGQGGAGLVRRSLAAGGRQSAGHHPRARRVSPARVLGGNRGAAGAASVSPAARSPPPLRSPQQPGVFSVLGFLGCFASTEVSREAWSPQPPRSPQRLSMLPPPPLPPPPCALWEREEAALERGRGDCSPLSRAHAASHRRRAPSIINPRG